MQPDQDKTVRNLAPDKQNVGVHHPNSFGRSLSDRCATAQRCLALPQLPLPVQGTCIVCCHRARSRHDAAHEAAEAPKTPFHKRAAHACRRCLASWQSLHELPARPRQLRGCAVKTNQANLTLSHKTQTKSGRPPWQDQKRFHAITIVKQTTKGARSHPNPIERRMSRFHKTPSPLRKTSS